MEIAKTHFAEGRRLWPAIGVALAGYACGGALAWHAGFHMIVTNDTLGHCLEAQYLRDRLLESLLYLHAQPPLLNLVLGLALKLEAAGGPAIRDSLFYLHAVLGALAAAGVGAIASLLIRPRVYLYACILLFTFHPVFYTYTFTFFYTIHELVLLLWGAFFAVRFWRHRGTLDFAAAGLLAVALVYTRSLFHPAWALGFIGILFVWSRKDRDPAASGRRQRAAVTAVLVAILFAWPLKNRILFGTFSYSSWIGYNLAHNYVDGFDRFFPDPRGFYVQEKLDDRIPVIWTTGHVEAAVAPRPEPLEIGYWVGHPDVSAARPVRVRMVIDGKLRIDDAVTSRGFRRHRLRLDPGLEESRIQIDIDPVWSNHEPRELGIALLNLRWVTTTGTVQTEYVAPAVIDYQVPPHLRHVPVIVDPMKTPISFNHNHYSVFDITRRGKEMTAQALKRDPWLFLERLKLNYLYFTRYTGLHYAGCYYVYEGTFMYRWLELWQGVLLQDYRPAPLLAANLRSFWPPSGFMFTFPLIVALAAVKSRSRWWRRPIDARLAALMLYSILWVFVIALLIDGVESNRMRFSTMPFLLILFFWLLPAPRRRVGAPRQAARRCQTAAIPR
ncbi:hypothetical protein LLG95_07075 [bacterium]|nr:hypothetical protein [bacterium]